MDNASLEDSVIVGDRLAQITAAFEALQRNTATRRRALEYGLAQASVGKTFEIQSVLGIGLISRPLVTDQKDTFRARVLRFETKRGTLFASRTFETPALGAETTRSGL